MKKRLGDRGFSLLELLVGVTMLAIIVVPVLHAFLTSSSTTAKASEVRNETAAAQNVLESYEATDMGAILQDIKKGAAPFDTLTNAPAQVFVSVPSGYQAVTSTSAEAPNASGYIIYLPGVPGGDKTYDAVLDISAATYSTRNAVGIIDYKPMDAVYIQPEPGNDSNPDVIAAKDFASQAQIDSGIVVQPDYFQDKMTRSVTITIKKLGGETGIVSCTALFHYKAHYEYTLADDSAALPTDEGATPPPAQIYEKDYTADIPNDFYSGSYDEADIRSYGLYFFFYPNVPSAVYPNTPGDTIDVVNSDKINMGVYLIRQSDDTSNPVIKLLEKAGGDNKPAAQMYYNNKVPYQYRYCLGYPDAKGALNYFWYKSFNFDGNLIGTPARNRLYGVTVKLYKAGSISDGSVSSSQPLATFDASSLG